MPTVGWTKVWWEADDLYNSPRFWLPLWGCTRDDEIKLHWKDFPTKRLVGLFRSSSFQFFSCELYCRSEGPSPGWERSPGEGHGNPLQYSCLESTMDRGAWDAMVHGVAKSWTWLSLKQVLFLCDIMVYMFWFRFIYILVCKSPLG